MTKGHERSHGTASGAQVALEDRRILADLTQQGGMCPNQVMTQLWGMKNTSEPAVNVGAVEAKIGDLTLAGDFRNVRSGVPLCRPLPDRVIAQQRLEREQKARTDRTHGQRVVRQ